MCICTYTFGKYCICTVACYWEEEWSCLPDYAVVGRSCWWFCWREFGASGFCSEVSELFFQTRVWKATFGIVGFLQCVFGLKKGLKQTFSEAGFSSGCRKDLRWRMLKGCECFWVFKCFRVQQRLGDAGGWQDGSPHNDNFLGLFRATEGPFCVQAACSLRLCMGFRFLTQWRIHFAVLPVEKPWCKD